MSSSKDRYLIQFNSRLEGARAHKGKRVFLCHDSARASDIWAIGVVALNFTAGLSDLVNKGDPPKYDYAAQDSMLAALSQGRR